MARWELGPERRVSRGEEERPKLQRILATHACSRKTMAGASGGICAEAARDTLNSASSSFAERPKLSFEKANEVTRPSMAGPAL